MKIRVKEREVITLEFEDKWLIIEPRKLKVLFADSAPTEETAREVIRWWKRSGEIQYGGRMCSSRWLIADYSDFSIGLSTADIRQRFAEHWEAARRKCALRKWTRG